MSPNLRAQCVHTYVHQMSLRNTYLISINEIDSDPGTLENVHQFWHIRCGENMEHFKPCPMSTVGAQDREGRVSTVPQYIIGCAAMVITALSALALVLAIAALVVGAIGLHGNRPFSDCHIQTFTETYVAHTSDTTFEYIFDTPAYNMNRTVSGMLSVS